MADLSIVSFDAPLTLYRLSKHGVLTDPIFLKPNTEVMLQTLGKASDTDLNETINNWGNAKVVEANPRLPSLVWPSKPNNVLHIPVHYNGKTYVARINKLVDEKKYKVHHSTMNEHLYAGASANTEASLPGRILDRACPNCGQAMDGQQEPMNASQRAMMAEFIRASNAERIGHVSADQPDQKYLPLAEDYNKSCQNFIDSDGNLGPFGKTIVAELDRPEYLGLYFEHPQMTKDCPNYMSFSKAQKQNFIINFFAHLSWLESTCGTDIKGSFGEMGLFQHENDSNIFKRRDILKKVFPAASELCRAPMSNHSNNIRCTIANMAAQLKGRFTIAEWNNYGAGATPQPMLSPHSTWGPIIDARNRRKPGARKPTGAYATMYDQVTSFPGCKGKLK